MATATETQTPQAAGTREADLDTIVRETEKRLLDRPELLQMRMENESIMAECRARPRDFGQIKRDLTVLLQEFPDLAESAIYHKPVGKNDAGQMAYATGLSIRAAEVLAEQYGWNRVRSDATPLDGGDKVKVDASFTDYQKGRVWQDGGMVSAYYKSRRGGMQRHPEDRFLNVVVKAEASKRVREVILRSVNSALKAWFENECRKVMAKRLNPEKEAAIVKAFQERGVTLEQLETTVGRPKAMGWTVEDRQLLAGIWNAIKDGESTVEEAFGQKPQTPPPSANGPASVEDLTGKTKLEAPQKPAEAEQPAFAESPIGKGFAAVLAKQRFIKDVHQEIDETAAQYPQDAEAIKAMGALRIAELRAKPKQTDKAGEGALPGMDDAHAADATA